MLKGRLGLDKTRIPYSDRHGVIMLERGKLDVEGGCLQFRTSGKEGALPAGKYSIPQQSISAILLGPGTSVTHDVFRLLAAHGTALMIIGEGGVRIYTAPPLMSSDSALARRQATLWATSRTRLAITRQMYAIRYGKDLPHRDISVMRGIEGARVKKMYAQKAEEWGIIWNGRKYDRTDPSASDIPNQAINHAASIITAAATIAVYATATIPQLGFIHETSSKAFILDIADLYREHTVLDIAFEAAKNITGQDEPIDRVVRRIANKTLRKHEVIPNMIDRIKSIIIGG